MYNALVYNKVQIESGEIGYIKTGQGRPMVMVTRYAATLYNWDKELINSLSQNFTLYMLEPRLVGTSNSTNANDISGYVNDIIQAIDALKISQPIVAGWSFGGVVVQQLYKAYKQNISGLIFLSSFPDPRIASEEFIELSMGVDKELTDESKMKLYYLMVSENPMSGAPNLMRQNVLNIADYHYRYTKAAKELHNQFVTTSPGSTIEELNEISVPCLVLNAQNDVSFPSSGREVFIKNIKKSKLIVYPSGGHLLIHHHGCEIAKDIGNYFNG